MKKGLDKRLVYYTLDDFLFLWKYVGVLFCLAHSTHLQSVSKCSYNYARVVNNLLHSLVIHLLFVCVLIP